MQPDASREREENSEEVDNSRASTHCRKARDPSIQQRSPALPLRSGRLEMYIEDAADHLSVARDMQEEGTYLNGLISSLVGVPSSTTLLNTAMARTS